jgi:diacylglycerol kinase (ATP)
MRAAAILGLGCSPKNLLPFQTDRSIEWRIGVPAVEDQVDVVVVFGGDGTVHRHLGHLLKLRAPVLVVPAGSGNDFASSLGLRRVRDSISAWQKFSSGSETVRCIDLGVISSFPKAAAKPGSEMARHFCCVAGVGFDGAVARRANTMPRWLRGHGGYVLSVLPTIFTFSALSMTIIASRPASDKFDWTVRNRQPTLLGVFANTPLYGGGMRVAPKAEMDDGLLDVCLVDRVHPLKLFSLFPTVYAGRHLRIREVQYFQTACVRVETEDAADVYADGEYVCQTPVEVSIRAGALKVIIPG